MTPKQYAQAFIELLNAGTQSDAALSGLDAALQQRGHEKLKRQILTIVHRTLTAHAREAGVTLTVAKEGDEKRYKAAVKAVCDELGIDAPTETAVDTTLIGGFVLATGTKRADRSYKRTLQNLYRNIIN